MDRSYWQSNDKEWFRERKLAWKVIKKNLLHTQYFDRSDLRYVEEYCLKGIEPCDDDSFCPDKSVTLLLILRLWLHPSDDLAVWEDIKDNAINGYDAKKNVEDSYLLLFRDGSSTEYSQDNGFSDGFFGGSEERLVRFFTGSPGDEKTIEVDGHNYDRYIKGNGLFLSFLDSTSMWLRSKKPVNFFCSYQYMLPGWVGSLNSDANFLETFVNDPKDIAMLGRYLGAIKGLSEYAKYKKGRAKFTDKARVGLAEKVCDFLDSDDAPKKLTELWLESQSKV